MGEGRRRRNGAYNPRKPLRAIVGEAAAGKRRRARVSDEEEMGDTIKYLLPETVIAQTWYKLTTDLPGRSPPAPRPFTNKPIGPDNPPPLFTATLFMQEVFAERQIEIPEPVRRIYRQWRPSARYRARSPDQALDTPARICCRYKGVSTAGSHNRNIAPRVKAVRGRFPEISLLEC